MSRRPMKYVVFPYYRHVQITWSSIHNASLVGFSYLEEVHNQDGIPYLRFRAQYVDSCTMLPREGRLSRSMVLRHYQALTP